MGWRLTPPYATPPDPAAWPRADRRVESDPSPRRGGTLSRPVANVSPRWDEEQVFFDGDSFFAALLEAVAATRRSIALEAYIFAWDVLGRRVAEALVEAAGRGVEVRVVVDSLGSLTSKGPLLRAFEGTGVQCRVYHQLPWERLPPTSGRRPRSIRRLVADANRRNHRKFCVLDGDVAFMGGMNVWDVHLRAVHGDAAWADVGVRLRGSGVASLVAAFERIWPTRMVLDALARHGPTALRRSADHPLVRLNDNLARRRRSYRQLLERLATARRRIWISTPYFVPTVALWRALRLAAARGVDVRILLPRHSDVFFMPWAARSLAASLLKAGVRVFEYLPSILHAKVTVVDGEVTLGSSNLNSRSLVHDLELDVDLTSENAREAVAEGFLAALARSREILPGDAALPWWKRVLGRLLLTFRHWL